MVADVAIASVEQCCRIASACSRQSRNATYILVYNNNVYVHIYIHVGVYACTGKSEIYEKAAFSFIVDACPAYIFAILFLHVSFFL